MKISTFSLEYGFLFLLNNLLEFHKISKDCKRLSIFGKNYYKMKKVLTSIVAVTCIALLSSCGEKTVDPTIVQAKVDSIAAEKIKAVSATAIAECETRMATEVKQKTDSLIHAAQMANAAQ